MNILAVDFQKRKLSYVSENKKELERHYQNHEKKISEFLVQMKDALTPRQYVQALEAISSCGHYAKIRDVKVLKFIDAYFLLI